MDLFEKKLPAWFLPERILCRFIAAWLGYTAIGLLGDNDYYKLESIINSKILYCVVAVIFAFSMMTLFAAVLSKIHTDSWWLLVFATICSMRWLIVLPHDSKNVYTAFAVAIFMYLVIDYFWKNNQNKMNGLLGKNFPRRGFSASVLFLLGLTTFVGIMEFSIYRYKCFMAPNFDFGLFVNMFHNMKHTGLAVATSERDRLLSHFAVHISPIFYCILPFYMLFPVPQTLQVAQALVLALGVIPVYLLARHYKLSRGYALVLAACYALFPAISTGCNYDLHENCFLPICILCLFYFFEKEKMVPMLFSAASLLMVKEDAAIYLLVFAVYIFFVRKKRFQGIILGTMAVIYFGFCMVLLNKYGEGVMSSRYANLILNPEDGLIGVIKTGLLNPGYLLTQFFNTSDGTGNKFLFFVQLMLPLGFLPICTKKASRWILIAPICINMLTTYKYLFDTGFQYQFGVCAFLVYVAIQNFSELSAELKKRFAVLAVLFATCMYIALVPTNGRYYRQIYKTNSKDYANMEAVLADIPKDASLNVSTMLLAHVANRDVIYEVYYHENKPDIDYVVLDMRYDNDEYIEAYIEQGYEKDAKSRGDILILAAPWIEK